MPATSGAQSTSSSGSTSSAGSSQSTGTAQRASSGGQVGSSGSNGGDYSLDTLPGGTSDGGGSGPMTSQERAAVLAGTLNRGYEDFDGFILEERARAQAEANAARNTGIPGDAADASGAGGAGGSPIVVAARPGGNASGPQGPAGAGGSGSGQDQTFAPPEDIPSGRDDDIVARQLREAAIHEPDPELREKLWDEYRKYTGVGG